MRTLLTVLLLTMPSISLVAADLTGQWSLGLSPDFSGHEDTIGCSFSQDGEKLTANCGAGPNILGEIKGQKVTLLFKTGLRNELTATFVGDLDQRETTISGTWQLIDTQGKREGKFTATKASASK
jgi:hypothetical protein